MYKRREPPPDVLWAEPNCTPSDASRGRIGVSLRGQCTGGYTAVAWIVTVALPKGAKYHETGLAHELRHAALMYDGIQDPSHLLPDWHGGGIVERTNKLLESRGY